MSDYSLQRKPQMEIHTSPSSSMDELDKRLSSNEIEALRVDIVEDGEAQEIPEPEVYDFEQAARYQIVAARKATEAPKSGFYSLDKYVSFVKGKTTVLGAETSVGKTTFSANIAANVAYHQKKKVLMFVPESGVEATVVHIACYLSNKREEELTDKDKRRDIPTLRLIGRSITINDIERIALIEKPDLIILDHIHYLIQQNDNMASSIGAAIRSLCTLAKKLKTHIIVIAHLKKPDNGRENEIPSIYRLKDSSALYQDPDLVILLHRKRRNPELVQPNEDRFEMDGLIVIDKNRINGKSGIVKFFFDKEKHTFFI